MNKHKISFIICANGLGHFKRCIRVIGSILEVRNYNIDIICQKWQRDVFCSTNLINHKNINWHLNFMEPGVVWPPSFLDENLIIWFRRIEHLLYNSNLIISDNLTMPLKKYKNVVLMGSFLWSDVFEYAFPNNYNIKRFIDLERSLLEENRPDMICIKDIAMDNVIKFTNAVKVPWMFENKSLNNKDNSIKKMKIGFLPGRKNIDKNIIRLAINLKANVDVDIFFPKYFIDVLKGYNIKMANVFRFSNEEFNQLDLILGRPGIGLITDCLKSNTFLLPIYEKNNLEMIHNSFIIEKNGWGSELNGVYDVDYVLDVIKKLQSYNKKQFDNVTFGGQKIVRDFLINKVEKS
tara:strand:+ start:1471 stop:2517 length:1047 start_codon:yes stop_codon:yes gene_type:complete